MFKIPFLQKSTHTLPKLQVWTCAELKLSVFIKCLLGDNPIKHNIGNWNELYAEYIDLLGDPKSMKSVFLERDIQVLKNRIGYIEIAGALWPNERAKSFLSKYGIRAPERVKAVVKSLNIDIKNKVAQMQSSKNGKEITAADFESNLVVLGKFNNGLNTDPEQISVARYCAMVNTLKEENARATRGNSGIRK